MAYNPVTRWRLTRRWRKQRTERGFSDRDMWNADMYLAGVFAGILQWYVDNGHGVSMEYAYDLDLYNPDVDIMCERRNADYSKYINIFKEYSTNGDAFDEKWQKEFGGVLDMDMQEALQWFSKHFTSLWD